MVIGASGGDPADARRLDAEARAEQVQRQLDATERLGRLGSYDWDIATGKLSWSDELFRIYGHDPGEFEPSYERFLERVVPEDRERIVATHREAVRTAGAFETEERIVRADGQVRTLLTNGMVLADESGQPLRLHGVCRDVTEQRAAIEHARQASSRYEALVEASPDAIVVVDREGRITSVNPQAEQFFGYPSSALVGMSVDELLPDEVRDRHAEVRRGFAAQPSTRPMAAGTDLQALRADGTLVPVDIALTPLDDGSHGVVAAFVRDATERRQAERARRRMVEAQLRRRQALELNDNVVQGLVALLWELEAEGNRTARRSAERTLAAARDMMHDLLEDLPDDPGLLVRTSQVSDDPAAPPLPLATSPPGEAFRIVIADDAADLRLLLRLRLDEVEGVAVVAEAGDGLRAVELCHRYSPDLVLLDLSMPVLDGLEAARRIREDRPAARIYVLSGYPTDSMRERALAAGADAYFQKSSTLDEVCGAVADLAREVDAALTD